MGGWARWEDECAVESGACRTRGARRVGGACRLAPVGWTVTEDFAATERQSVGDLKKAAFDRSRVCNDAATSGRFCPIDLAMRHKHVFFLDRGAILYTVEKPFSPGFYSYPCSSTAHFCAERSSDEEKPMGKQAGIHDSGHPHLTCVIQNTHRDDTHLEADVGSTATPLGRVRPAHSRREFRL